MIENLKNKVRNILVNLPIRITKNQWYDHCTNKIIKQFLHRNSNCIDVGCHKGEVLDTMYKYAPDGNHFGFEPIPSMFEDLKIKYSNQTNIKILPFALSNDEGFSTFNYVKSNPAYSGLVKRTYDHDLVIDEEIAVQKKLLDDCIPTSLNIDLIKIDVEGGEMGVLKGSQRILKDNKPLIIFEHGLGASEHYGTTPEEIFLYLSSFNYKIYLLESYLNQNEPLSKAEFEQQFYKKLNYYFVAKPTT